MGVAPFGCNGGPWHLMGLQQCGGQAGTVSHFGYVHIRSRSMAPPDVCHFLRSNTQTWKNRKEQTVTFSTARLSVSATSGPLLAQAGEMHHYLQLLGLFTQNFSSRFLLDILSVSHI